MDVLRACAYLDLINGVPADRRIAAAGANQTTAPAPLRRVDGSCLTRTMTCDRGEALR